VLIVHDFSSISLLLVCVIISASVVWT